MNIEEYVCYDVIGLVVEICVGYVSVDEVM